MKDLTREEALDWCVENVNKWPNISLNVIDLCDWSFGNIMSDIRLGHPTKLPITEQDWLDAKASKDKNMIDWTNTPEGATHYTEGDANWNFCWYKKEKDTWFYQNNKRAGREWDESSEYHSDLLLVLKEIPTDQPYMPEIGENCETNMGFGWFKCEILAHKMNLAGMVAVYCFYEKGDLDGVLRVDMAGFEYFRPIKTEREIERDELVKTLTVLVGDFTNNVYSKRLRSGLNKQQCTLEDEDVCRYIVEALNWRPTDAPNT